MDNDAIVTRQADAFCALTDPLAGVEYASLMKSYWRGNTEKRRAWLHVGRICECFMLAEWYPISMIAEVLGVNVALKLCCYYILQHIKYQIPPKAELVRYFFDLSK